MVIFHSYGKPIVDLTYGKAITYSGFNLFFI